GCGVPFYLVALAPTVRGPACALARAHGDFAHPPFRGRGTGRGGVPPQPPPGVAGVPAALVSVPLVPRPGAAFPYGPVFRAGTVPAGGGAAFPPEMRGGPPTLAVRRGRWAASVGGPPPSARGRRHGVGGAAISGAGRARPGAATPLPATALPQ